MPAETCLSRNLQAFVGNKPYLSRYTLKPFAVTIYFSINRWRFNINRAHLDKGHENE